MPLHPAHHGDQHQDPQPERDLLVGTDQIPEPSHHNVPLENLEPTSVQRRELPTLARLVEGERSGDRRTAIHAPPEPDMAHQLHHRHVHTRPGRRVMDTDADGHCKLLAPAGAGGSPSTPTSVRTAWRLSLHSPTEPGGGADRGPPRPPESALSSRCRRPERS